MQLYPRAERIYAELEALGIHSDAPVSVETLNRFDQLHYHGTVAIDAAIASCGVKPGDKVLEIGSGWGGCARYIVSSCDAHVTAIELQEDYNNVAQDLTRRSNLSARLTHVNADFLEWNTPNGQMDHAMSWLALFHIPNRAEYLSRVARCLRTGGNFAAEDLFLISSPPEQELLDFEQNLFPNSLVAIDEYKKGIEDAGFEFVETQDMTQDWTSFTAERLEAFRQNQSAYKAIHGPEGFQIIETFYDKMASYFERGFVGGIRFHARKS